MVGTVRTGTKIVLVSLVIMVAMMSACMLLSAGAAVPTTDTGAGKHKAALEIGDMVPDLAADAYYNDSIARIKFGDYRGKWMVLIFYPADFTFVCPTELEEMASLHSNFTGLGAEVFSVSRDTAYVHKAWHESDPRIGKIMFPMIADTTGDICRAFGMYNETSGLSRRASFIFDPDGRLIALEMHDDSFGRSTRELLRQLEAAKFVREHQGKVCPASWKPGEEAIQP
jgi:peroxiredoxin (alkyl hydroperoxide reductase subunit C)